MASVENYVEKKSAAKERHKEVAEKFKEWLDKHPQADKKRVVQTFDAFCDSSILNRVINGKPKKP